MSLGTRLSTRVALGGERALEDVLADVAKHADVVNGRGAHDADIRAVEDALDVTFPDEYRAFLRRYEYLTVRGDPDYGPSEVIVFKLAQLSPMRDRLRAQIVQHALGDARWLHDARPPREDEMRDLAKHAPPSLEEARAELARRLEISEVDAGGEFWNDSLDEWRFACRALAPVISLNAIRREREEELMRGVECIGPASRMYDVDMHNWWVEPSNDGFHARLLRTLGYIFIKE